MPNQNKLYVSFYTESELKKAFTFFSENKIPVLPPAFGSFRVSPSILNKIKESDLEFKVYPTIQELGRDKKLRKYWNDVLEEKYRNAYVSFQDEEEFELAIDYLGQREINGQMMGSGTLEVGKKVPEILKEAGFSFKEYPSMAEVYEDKELAKYWDNLINKKYGLDKT